MDRIFVREKQAEESFCLNERVKIGVTGMSGGAGATFVATSIAKILSQDIRKKVTFLELCGVDWLRKPLLYDALGMDKRFAGHDFVRFYEEVREGRSVKGKVNLDGGVNWALVTPSDMRKRIALNLVEQVRLAGNVSGDVIVCDVGEWEGCGEFLKGMDLLLFVIDPLPSALFLGFSKLQEMKRLAHQGMETVFLINKYNGGINKRELFDFLKLKSYYVLPLLDPEKFYAAEYNCKIPYERREIREMVKEILTEIVKKHILFT